MTRASQALLTSRPERVTRPDALPTGLRRLGLGGTRDALLFIPSRRAEDRPMPLVLGFHGAGGVGAQMVDMLRSACEARGVAILAPDSRGATWDIIRGAYGPDIAFIDRALRSVFDEAPIDSARIAAAGFSDGASYALSVGIANGPLFSDILAFSPGFMAPPAHTGRPRVFISHGVGDEVLPIAACSRQIVPRLTAAGYDVAYEEFDGGHVVPSLLVERSLTRFLT
jgi:phospholipase/carboxylesterase